MPVELCDLPLDLLEDIVDSFVASYATTPSAHAYSTRDRKKLSHRPLWSLSQSCRTLNDVCARHIFARYVLTFRRRTSYSGSGVPRPLTPRDAEVSYSVWDEEAVRQRIAHFYRVAHCVRDLLIWDWGSKEVLPLPEAVMPQLVDALAQATRLRKIKFKVGGTSGVLHPMLWDALHARKLSEIAIRGLAAPPQYKELKPMLSVEKLKLEYRERSRPFLELFDPSCLVVKYMDVEWKLTDAPPLLKLTSSKLRHVKATYAVPGHPLQHPIFDLSAVPQASVRIIFLLCCELKLHIPAVWRSMKQSVRIAFAEGLDGYNVQRTSCSDAWIHRPALVGPGSEPNFKPAYAVHLEGDDVDRREARKMREYYMWRTRMEFFGSSF